ncbi:MAG: isoprenylcysteine carboxylmethyltransferase family protein [Spirochaetales bacterium]|nr:isoprenylcysteine carboxylmethyltransferase family protein [Spirochaetales bacterium]
MLQKDDPSEKKPHKSLNRGQVWVVGQLILGFAVLVAALPWHAGFFWPGLVVLLFGAGTAFWALLNLGKSLSVFPLPKDDAVFVGDGLYRWVRHPIYSGLLLAGLGWALLWLSWAAGLVWLVFAVWMDRKAAAEEAWLVQKYSNYADYRRRVRKFIPLVW